MIMINPFVDGDGIVSSSLCFPYFLRAHGGHPWKKYYESLYPTRKPADFAEYSAALYTNLKQPGV
jgi:hypothetical protein